MSDPKQCRHVLEQPENAEWPEPVYWDHYCNCLTDEQRRETLAKAREWAGKGSACVMRDHQYQLERQSAVLGETGVALAAAADILAKHHDFLDTQMQSYTYRSNPAFYNATKDAHDNLVGLMDKALEARDRG